MAAPIQDRVQKSAERFRALYKREPALVVNAPGRAEVIGNHTDYNSGYALACALSQSIVAVSAPRDDGMYRVFSDTPGYGHAEFRAGDARTDKFPKWVNYARATVRELEHIAGSLSGADLYLSTNLPGCGGVSTSAAYELAVAQTLKELYQLSLSPLDLALLCKRAENGPLVNSPCGLLDQAAVALSKKGSFLFLDFLARENTPLETRLIPADVARDGCSFLVTVDPEVKRNLGESGYPERRRMCESSLPLLGEMLRREVGSLREVSVDEFYSVRSALEARGGKKMVMRVEHIVKENQRVLDSVAALEAQNINRFGELLTESGHSSLELYELADGTPELAFLVEQAREIGGVLGVRNQGGGFSANTLALVTQEKLAQVQETLAEQYSSRFGRMLQFIVFDAADGVKTLQNGAA